MNSAWNELLGTDVGLLSLGVIVGVVVIAIAFYWLIRRKLDADQ